MKAFTATADSLRDKFSFAHTLAKEVMDEYGFEEWVQLKQELISSWLKSSQ